MKYFSTRDKSVSINFEKAVMMGLAPDGGLYMPEYISPLKKSILENLKDLSFQEISLEIVKHFAGEEIPLSKLEEIINKAIFFDAPVVQLDNYFAVLELFHGPTLAFKDFGAQFMARTMEYFVRNENRELVILVATSGDTGSAVANGFYEVEGIKVFILYPSGKVSEIQEKQLTTLGKNITALEIDGTFDDCQKLVKEAFVDKELTAKINLSSANSINIARLIPQSFYYTNAVKHFNKNDQIVISVPSGNLGNLTAGLFAKKMGVNIHGFVSATNSNKVFTDYLQAGIFEPRYSILTYSNAMDVGNPSNLERIQTLFNSNLKEIKNEISSYSFNDEETLTGIIEVFEKYGYIIDPHGAVGFNALKKYFQNTDINNAKGIVVETAHPSKFIDVIEKAIQKDIEIPERLASVIKKEKHSFRLDKSFASLKAFLLGM